MSTDVEPRLVEITVMASEDCDDSEIAELVTDALRMLRDTAATTDR